MKQNCEKRLARFLKDLGPEHDTFDVTILTLTALINSLEGATGGLDIRPEAFKRTLSSLICMIRQARPDSVPLNHLLNYLELDLSEPLSEGETPVQRAVRHLNQRICQVERHRDALSERGMVFVEQKDCILVHAPDESLIRTLVRAKTQRDLTVIVPDLYPEKTRRIVAAFREAGVVFDLIRPEAVTASLARVTKLFLGAMPVTRDKKILAPAGTADLIRSCRDQGIFLYFFADTLHYAFGKTFEQPVFSAGRGDRELAASVRDLVPLDLIHHVVTEIGEVTRTGLLMSGPKPYSEEAVKADPDRSQVPAEVPSGHPISA